MLPKRERSQELWSLISPAAGGRCGMGSQVAPGPVAGPGS